MIADKACYERGCACYDPRVDSDGVEVVAKREWVGLTDRDKKIIMFAVHRFMSDAYSQGNAAAQDHDNRYFKPGAVDAFHKDAKDAEELIAKLKEKNFVKEKNT